MDKAPQQGGRKRKRRRKVPEHNSTANIGEYRRDMPKMSTKGMKDKKLKSTLQRQSQGARAAAYEAVRSEILLPEQAGSLEAEGMERTYHFTQAAIKDAVDVTASRKIFDLDLPQLGPYAMRYTRNGRHVLIGGRKGHVASFDWKTGSLGCELQLGERVRDVTWLQNETMFAVAQKKHVYIYDDTGAEIHIYRKHVDVHKLEYLPYHFLLASVGNAGWLKYHDVSEGKLVAELRTKLGPCKVMRQNPRNGVLHCGHTNGTVTLWTPNMSTFAVKQLCHRGPVQALAMDVSGLYMATAGLDGQMKVWDIRNFKDKPLQQYFTPTPATCLDISQRNMLAVGHGSHVQVWSGALTAKQKSPLMNHQLPGCVVEQCRFAPFEDVLGIGHTGGFSSILVPGSGEPNFDASEANVYETKSQRREVEVKRLLEKIPSELISLNPDEILQLKSKEAGGGGGIRDHDEIEDELQTEEQILEGARRQRGRNSSKIRFLRKKSNVVDGQKARRLQKLVAEREAQAKAKAGPAPKKTALDRFNRKPEY